MLLHFVLTSNLLLLFAVSEPFFQKLKQFLSLKGCCLNFITGEDLFRQLFLIKRESAPGNLAAINEAMIEKAVKPLAEKAGVSIETAEKQCIKLWVFTHGMASLAAMGLLQVSEEDVEDMLREAEKNYALN